MTSAGPVHPRLAAYVGSCPRAVLVDLLAALAPGATGAQVTVFDPDLDPGGTQARLLADVVVAGLGELGASRQTGSGR